MKRAIEVTTNVQTVLDLSVIFESPWVVSRY